MKTEQLTSFEWSMLCGAILYYHNRKTAASCMFPSEVIKDMYHRLTSEQKEAIVSQLRDVGIFGHEEVDDIQWQRFRAALDEKSHYKVKMTYGVILTVFEASGGIYSLTEYLKHPFALPRIKHDDIQYKLETD